MQNIPLEQLLDKARGQEKRYEWLQAAEYYKKAAELASNEKDFLKAAELQEQIGFCFFKAALQADTNGIFRDRMKLAVIASEKTLEILQKVEEKENKPKIYHAKALVAYASSWLERDFTKKSKLLDEWWRLENRVLNEYEVKGDALMIGRVCNDLLQGSQEYRWWLVSESDFESMVEELLSLGEKSIATLSNLNEDYELARAYCWTSFYCTLALWMGILEKRKEEIGQKSLNYSKEALALSEKMGDPWLTFWANNFNSLAQLTPTSDTSWASLTLKPVEKGPERAKITKDHYLMGIAHYRVGPALANLKLMEEDPEKYRQGLKTALKLNQDAVSHFHIIDFYSGQTFTCYHAIVKCLEALAKLETKPETKRSLLEEAVEVGQEGYIHTQGHREGSYTNALEALSEALCSLAAVEQNVTKKKQFLEEALKYSAKVLELCQEYATLTVFYTNACSINVLIQAQLAEIATEKKEKNDLLRSVLRLIENTVKLIEKDTRMPLGLGWKNSIYGNDCYSLAGILKQLYLQNKDRKILDKAIKVYGIALENFGIAELPSRMAESYWQIAELYDQQSLQQKASKNFDLAAESYDQAGKKIPQLKQFYEDYSSYMRAWSQIEQAKYSHSIEEYEEARQHYKKAAELHKSTDSWNYLTTNYLAWANMEEAEGLSRKENTPQAKQTFQKANEQFCEAKTAMKEKLEEITSPDEKEMATRLLKATDLRRKFCQARILLEEAKLQDRKGKYLNSSKSYAEAAKKIDQIITELESETERKEVNLIAVLCRAWEKMAMAEETSSSESYLEAAKLFGHAKNLSVTKKTSLWALGNSSFCKGLAAGTKYQDSLDLAEHALAKGHMKNAASNYLQAGFKNASEYAKATQRLFDAHVFMNQAEGEVDQEKKIKHYKMAEKLLQISAGSFLKAKQPEKTAQVQLILKTVREERKLAVSLNEVLHAPAIASTTSSFATPIPTSEVSVGLEQFEHANVQANLTAAAKKVKVGQSFCLTLEFVNAGKEPALLTRVEEIVPSDFIVVKKPEIYRLEDACLNMKGKQLVPLKLVEAKLVLQPSKKGIYHLKPKVHYLDERGQNKSLELKSLEIKVEEIILSDRVATGTKELDALLLGGIPEGYAVALTGPPSDERETIIKDFLQAGTKNKQITFHVTTEPIGLDSLFEKPDFYLFLCNPKPKAQVPELANIYKLQGITDLTNLSITLSKACRKLDGKLKCPSRVCVEIVSDVLIRYKAEATRRWISELITDMGSRGFTLLAVMDPDMHPTDQAKAVLNLFDGEISLYQTDDPMECKKSIRVKKLRNQDYIKNPICLTKSA